MAMEKEGMQWDDVYTVYLSEAESPVDVYCRDMDKPHGGWTVMQRRYDGSESFNRGWFDYKGGFGDVESGEYMMGLEHVHMMTAAERQTLRVELTDWSDKVWWSEFQDFKVADEKDKYKLKKLGKQEGNAGETLMDALGKTFSTKDRDNDLWKGGNCAKKRQAGWWFGRKACSTSCLNGPYKKGQKSSGLPGIQWDGGHFGKGYNYKKSEMLLKPYYPFE